MNFQKMIERTVDGSWTDTKKTKTTIFQYTSHIDMLEMFRKFSQNLQTVQLTLNEIFKILQLPALNLFVWETG